MINWSSYVWSFWYNLILAKGLILVSLKIDALPLYISKACIKVTLYWINDLCTIRYHKHDNTVHRNFFCSCGEFHMKRFLWKFHLLYTFFIDNKWRSLTNFLEKYLYIYMIYNQTNPAICWVLVAVHCKRYQTPITSTGSRVHSSVLPDITPTYPHRKR